MTLRAGTRKKLAAAKRAQNAWGGAENPQVMQHQALFAIMRREGRVRLTFEDIEAIPEGATIDTEVDEEHGWVTLTWNEHPAESQAPSSAG